ncbi:MAG: undecaprenyl-phosphate glucose phosphotransferase [Pseudomonadota bacterium]
MDGVIVLIAGVLSYLIYFGIDAFPIPPHYSLLGFASALMLVATFSSTGVYRSWRGSYIGLMLGRVVLGWVVTVISLLVVLFLLKASEDYSRLLTIIWSATTAVLLIGERLLLFYALRWLRMRGRNHKRVILVGYSEVTRELIRRINSATWTGFDVVAVFDDQATESNSIEGVPLSRDLAEIENHIKNKLIAEVWITLPLRDEARVRHVLHLLRHSTVNVRYVPDIFAFRLINHGVSEIAGMPMLDLSTTPMTGVNLWIKAIEDRVLAALILLGISPLLMVIALAVKLSSPGPILFKQKRHGWDGREITVYKFRSMVNHQENSGRVTQACKGDPRITPVGAFLRRTSLDELPQFLNVLQGRMSIVGPRPHAIAHNEQYKELIDDYMQRHKVKPGITGWAQINGYRGETDTLEKMQKRIEYDLYYIEHWSLWFDLKIIILTIFKGFIHKNAY